MNMLSGFYLPDDLAHARLNRPHAWARSKTSRL
jgi:hypothetical protein